MKFKALVEYDYPVDHKPPVKAEIILHGDRVVTNNIKRIGQEPTWIPVSERLPKKGEIVLWCNKDGRVFSSAITYLTKTSFSVGKHYDVIAWQPLPEPYKAESEGK